MKTIEERAIEYQGKLASSFLGYPELLEGGYEGYIIGAEEQKEIDDVKWGENKEKLVENFRNALTKRLVNFGNSEEENEESKEWIEEIIKEVEE